MVSALLTPNSMGMPQKQHTPSPDSPVADSFALGPSHEIHGNVGKLNIVEGPCTRKLFQWWQAYIAALELLPEQLSAFQEAYAVGALHRDPCLHHDQLPRPPHNWYELQRHPEQDGFMRAAQKEYEAVTEKKTFQVVSKQDASNIIPLTWVFDYRFDQDGYLTRYKARICICRNLQPISKQDTYAAIVKMKILRFLLALTAAYDLNTWYADVTNAFLNSILDKTVYCKFSDGFSQPEKCLRLLCTLYGLRRASWLWQQEFVSTLKGLELQQILEEPCLFTNDDGIFLLFYIDDILLLSCKDRSW